jgi:acetylornithine/succinyldiaminopimelate/putrescine aminotransferase
MTSRYIAKTYKVLLNNSKPVIIKGAKGSKFYDVTGKSYFDATSSYCAANFGHANPYFKKVLIDQTNKMALCPRFLENQNLNRLGLKVNTFFYSFSQ